MSDYDLPEHIQTQADAADAVAALTSPRYPNIEVRLSGSDGNAFVALGKVASALRRAGVPASEIERFQAQAKAGDYNHLLRSCMAWVSVS